MTFDARRARLVWLLVLASACASPASPTEVDGSAAGGGTAAADIGGTILRLTNIERSKGGIAPLRVNSRLRQAAQLQADQMASRSRLDHVISGSKYPRPEDRLAAAGYQWQDYAENIAMGQGSADVAMDAWMHSSGHRANIMNAALTEIGVGFARDSAGRPYYVQVFGNPRP